MRPDLGNEALFTLDVDGCDEELRVVRFRGVEAISSLFEFRVEIASGELALDALIGAAALLTIGGIEGPRHVHGFVCQAEYIGDSRRYALYELTIVPSIWRLRQRVGSRIFPQMKTPEILAKILAGLGAGRYAHRAELQASYGPRDYCVQYGESDLEFFHRLAEADGILYHFEHSESEHVLVLTDERTCKPHPAGDLVLPWAPAPGIVHEREHVTRFRFSEAMRPERVSLRDFNLHEPSEGMEASHGRGDEREVYEYPGNYQSVAARGPERGATQAKLRLEALQASQRRAFGTSDCPRLVPGFAFTLADHRWPDYDGDYRVVRVTHHGEQPQALDEDAAGEFSYSNEFECTPREAPYRAPRITPRPTVRGVQTATVVGPPGEDVWVDEHGRVKVEFHWDRRDEFDVDSSCWVRVSQLWAGNGFGTLFLPRIGHEVIVDFIEGDPDRPLITGRVYTGTNRPPYPLPQQKTKSTIKTHTSDGGGSNELRFEDARGNEEIYVHGQKDWTIEIENDKRQTIGRDDALTVGNDRAESIGRDAREQIERDRTIKVGNAHTEQIGADMSITVGADLREEVCGSMTVQVGRNLTETVKQNIVLDAGKHLTIKTGDNVTITSGKQTRLEVGTQLTIQCGAATITVDKSGAVAIKAQTFDLQASGEVTVKGATINLN